MDIPAQMDGAVKVQPSPSINPGNSFDYRFKVINPPGTHMYHTHYNSMKQQMMGLAGGLIINFQYWLKNHRNS